MKLPEIASKRNRIRDAKILQLYVEKALTQDDISERFGLSQSRINQILKANAHLILREKDWNKIQRLNLIKNQLSREEVKSIAVSPDKWIDLWRKETDGESAVQVHNNNVIQVYVPSNEEHDTNDNRISSENLEAVERSTNGVSPEHGV